MRNIIKKLLLISSFVMLASYTNAQDSPLGKPKDEIRNSYQSLIPLIKTLKSDSCDIFEMPGGIETAFYYKNNICIRTKQTFPLVDSVFLVDELSKRYKKTGQDKWVTKNGKEEIRFLTDSDEKQCSIVFSEIKK